MSGSPVDPARARVAVAVAFAAAGLVFASWLARTPGIRDALALTPVGLGLLLLCGSGGAVLGLPSAGPVVARLGPARAVLLGAGTVTVGVLGLAAGLATATVPPAAAGLVLLGLGTGVWDVAMNVAGADVERRLGRPLMPRLHAAFSLGTVAGAGVGAGSAALGIGVAVQVTAVAGLTLGAVAVAVRAFPVAAPGPDPVAGTGRPGLRAAWREPRTLLVGLSVLAFAFTEGVANDWLAVALVDGHGAGPALGAVGFGVFVAAMTATRLLGGSVLARFGRVRVLRTSALVALAGLALVVLAPTLAWTFPGALLWGIGAALGFPVGMSAAAGDTAAEPRGAALRVSVVSSIGYTAFLAGPPLIGLLAEHAGIRTALTAVVGALLLALLTCGATRPVPAPVRAGDAAP